MRLLREVTGMRGFAAFYVLLLHVIILYGSAAGSRPGGASTIMNYGWIGVDFFFVLSGFLLSIPLLGKPATMQVPGFWRRYVAKRWWRIAPPYYVSILVAVVLTGQLAHLTNDPRDTILHLTFLHSTYQPSLISINPVYWTLASEFQFYLLVPAFVLLLRGRAWPIGIAALGAATLLWRGTTYQGPAEAAWLSFTLPGFLLHFGLGLLAARAFLAGRRSPIAPAVALPIAAALLLVVPLLTLGTPGFNQGDQNWLSNLLLRPILGLGFATIIFLVCSQESGFRRLFSSRAFVAIGEISYSLYLTHIPVLLFMNKWPVLAAHGLGAYLVLAIFVTLLAGAAFYLLVERPSLAMRERFVGRRQSIPTGTLVRVPHVAD